jgi:hypothetical protein
VITDPEPELCEILTAELRNQVPLGVTASVMDGRRTTHDFSGAAVTGLMNRAEAFWPALPAGVPRHLLRVRSVTEHLAGQKRPNPSSLIGVASSSAQILARARTILSAAGLEAGALEFRDAREPGWRRGLTACDFVIADVLTARRLPAGCSVRILQVVSSDSIEDLRKFLRLVTDPKVS